MGELKRKGRFCRRCDFYHRYDDYFGYCMKYRNQARHDDTCEIIKEMLPNGK